jgi:prepilin-type N-terminal cleavage/methylation domain-containing protein
MSSRPRRHSGFTLIEMLMVIVLIATVSVLAITLTSGLSTETNETVNLANNKRLTSTAETYYLMHRRTMPDGLDSLLHTNTAAATGIPTTDGGWLCPGLTDGGDASGSLTQHILYYGTDKDANFVRDDLENDANGNPKPAKFKGLSDYNSTGFGQALMIYRLSATDVTNLAQIGISGVYDINPATDRYDGQNHDNYATTRRVLKAGGLVAAISPYGMGGRSGLYKDFGVDTSTLAINTTTYPAGTVAWATQALSKKRFLVFGLGKNATWIGNQSGGVQEASICPTVSDGVYNNYFVVIAMPGGPTDATPACPVGILDSNGFSARGASSWASRTNRE